MEGAMMCCRLSPCFMILFILLLGRNEQTAVCQQKAIDEGRNSVIQADCRYDPKNDGKLIMWSCNLETEGLDDSSIQPFGDFENLTDDQTYVGISRRVQMRQCVEKKKSEKKKDPIGGGTTTVTTYSYSVQWKERPIDSSTFKKKRSDSFRRNCGIENPRWPNSLPRSGESFVDQAMLGGYTVPKQIFEKKLLLKTPLTSTEEIPGWTLNGDIYNKPVGLQNGIGDLQVKFKSNDPSAPMTFVGTSMNGQAEVWNSTPTWLCSEGSSLMIIKEGIATKEELF